MGSLKMFVEFLKFCAVLLSSDILTRVNCKCYYTECIVLAKQKCPDGYTQHSSKPCLFGLFGSSYLCCKTEDETTVAPSSSTTSPNGDTTTTGTPSLLQCEKVRQGELPFVVALTRFSNSKTYHFCDGSILSPYWVLTSGRCLFDDDKNPLNANDIIATAASLDLQTLEGTEQIVTVDQFYIHQDYDINNITQYANIALLRLVHSFEFNEYVSSIALPPAEFDTNALTAVMTASWKITDLCETTNSSAFLQKVNVPIVEDNTCSKIYNMQVEPKGQMKTDSTSQICTVGNSEYKDCPAGAGGSLQCESYVCGIVSMTTPADASMDLPNIYTDVTFFREFVEKTMNAR